MIIYPETKYLETGMKEFENKKIDATILSDSINVYSHRNFQNADDHENTVPKFNSLNSQNMQTLQTELQNLDMQSQQYNSKQSKYSEPELPMPTNDNMYDDESNDQFYFHKETYTNQNVPNLAIIGPSKTATTSLFFGILFHSLCGSLFFLVFFECFFYCFVTGFCCDLLSFMHCPLSLRLRNFAISCFFLGVCVCLFSVSVQRLLVVSKFLQMLDRTSRIISQLVS